MTDELEWGVMVDDRGRLNPVPLVPKDAVNLAVFMAQAFSPELWSHREGAKMPMSFRIGQEVTINKMLLVLQNVPELRRLFHDDGTTGILIRRPKVW